MATETIQSLAQQLAAGKMSVEQFLAAAGHARTAELGDAALDLDRRRRCGYPEVVYGESKSVATLTRIFRTMLDNGSRVLATRVSADKAGPLIAAFPHGRYNELGRTFRIDGTGTAGAKHGQVAVVTAGTSDLPVAEESRETLDWMDTTVTLIQDVGVAGPHRLLAHVDTLRCCDAIVVVAGMEGALPSIVGGYVPCPVIGVPTSVGYGSSFAGVAALLGMLNSCAANVTVVNIDGGFKGGYIAGMIARAGRRPND